MFASREVRGVRIHSVALYIIVILVIVVHGLIIRRYHVRDPLARRLYYHPLCQDIDGWSVTHFMFFGLLGILFPGKYLQFFLVGAGWEVVETILGQHRFMVGGHRVQLTGDQDEEGYSTGNDDSYWYGRSSDILVDMLGYTLGSTWAEKYWPDRPKAADAERPAPTVSFREIEVNGRPVPFPEWV